MPQARRRSAAHIGVPYDHGEPIWRPSVAPIAAVWLVIGGIIALNSPMKTHVILIDLPMLPMQGTTEEAPAVAGPVVKIRVGENGELYWNDAPVSAQRLTAEANAIQTGSTLPVIKFTPEANAPYLASLQALQILVLTGLTDGNFCFGDLDAHRKFGRAVNRGAAFPTISSASTVRLSSITSALPMEQAICDSI